MEAREKFLRENLNINGLVMNVYVTQHEKIGLMCTQNLTTFWISNLDNFLSNQWSAMKFTTFIQHFMERHILLTDLLYLIQYRRYTQLYE